MKYNNNEYIVMGTNYNRIKVVNLEENLSNKILKTNTSEELELNNTAFPDLINTSTDLEIYLTSTVNEEKKIVNGLKLFNWWKHIKSLLLKWYYKMTTIT